MESQVFQRVISDAELLMYGSDALHEQVNHAVRILNEQCARYIADNLPHDAYQLLKIDRMVTRDEAMARTIVAVWLDVGEVTAHPRTRVWFDEASDSSLVYSWPQLAPQMERAEQERQFAERRVSATRNDAIAQAPDGEAVPVYPQEQQGSIRYDLRTEKDLGARASDEDRARLLRKDADKICNVCG